VGSKPWYEADTELYGKVKREVEEAFPELRFINRGRDIVVTGYYPIYEGERVLDRYLVEVEPSKESPRGLPVVREVGGRIPLDRDRHINPEDGTACVVFPDAFWYENPDGMNLLEFLNRPLRSFFASQSLVELGYTNPWPSGEWEHGVDGIIEFYGNLVGTRNPEIVWEYLRILKRELVKGHWSCPCGSGEKLRKCHRSLIEKLRSRIPRNAASQSEGRVLEQIRKISSRPKYGNPK